MFHAKQAEADEKSLLSNKKSSQLQSRLSCSWLVLVFLAIICLCTSGFFWHSKVAKEKELMRLRALLGGSKLAKGKLLAESAISTRDYLRCNSGLAPAQLSSIRPDDTLAGQQCGWAEAVAISEALRNAGYNFEATTPRPYIFTSYLQQVLSTLKAEQLTVALKHLQQHAPAGKLGTLVKFFAWGLPVASSDLESALDLGTLIALLRCDLLAPCSRLPGAITSTAMILPVPNSSVMMATDWSSRSTAGSREEVVPIVTPESMALIYNMPSPKGLDVLDFDSGTGVHGMVAAQQGAASATLFFTNVRSMRFARFSAWLNHLTRVVSIHSDSAEEAISDGLLGSHNIWDSGFGLVLAQPPFHPVPSQEAETRFPRNGGRNGTKLQAEVINLAQRVTKSDGLLAFVSQFGAPILVPPLCDSFGLPGFKGTLIIQEKPITPQAFAAAHGSLGSVDSQVSNMAMHAVNGVASGILFAKRVSPSEGDGDCGALTMKTMKDPLEWQRASEPTFKRACSLSQETECPKLA